MRKRYKIIFVGITILIAAVACYSSDRIMFFAIDNVDVALKRKLNLSTIRDGIMKSVDQFNPIKGVVFSNEDDLPIFDLKLSYSDLNYLNSVKNRSDTMISNYHNDFRKAKLYFSNKEYKVKVRYHGSDYQHIKNRKRSYAIKLAKTELINNMRRFSFIIPDEMGIADILYYRLLADLHGFEVKIYPCRLKINGVDQGVYLLEERLHKVMLERNGFAGMDIIKPMDEWTHQYPFAHTEPYTWDVAYTKFKNITKRDLGQLARYKALYSDLKKEEIAKLIDIDWYAKLDALRILFGAQRAVYGDNQRLLYSTVTGKFLPLFRIEREIYRLHPNVHSQIFEQSLVYLNHAKVLSDYTYQKYYQNSMYVKLVQNDEYRNLRNEYLYKLLQMREDIVSLYDTLYEKNMPYIVNDLSNPHPSRQYTYDEDIFKKAFIHNLDFIEKYFAYSRTFMEVEQINSKRYLLRIRPDSNVPLKINKLRLFLNKASEVTIKSSQDPQGQSFEVQKKVLADTNESDDKQAYIVDVTPSLKNDSFVLGLTEHLEIKKREYIYTIETDRPVKVKNVSAQFYNFISGQDIGRNATNIVIVEKPESFEFDYLERAPTNFIEQHIEFNFEISGNSFILKKGNYIVRTDVIFPYGMNLVVEKGSRLNLAPNKSLIVYGGITIQGTQDEPVVISNLEHNKPFGVVAAVGVRTKTKVDINHLKLHGGREAVINGISFLGALSLYNHHAVRIRNSTIYHNSADDGLNINNAMVELYNNVFGSNIADQVDLDNCVGLVDQNQFHWALEAKGNQLQSVSNSMNGDGLDLSHSKIIIKENQFDGFLDKAISIGEKSIAFVTSNRFSNNRSSITLKDQSKGFLESNIYKKEDATWIEAYQKKPFFDHPTVYNFNEKHLKNKVLIKGDSKYFTLNKRTPFEDTELSMDFNFESLDSLIE